MFNEFLESSVKASKDAINSLVDAINTVRGESDMSVSNHAVGCATGDIKPTGTPIQELYRTKYYDSQDNLFINESSQGFMLELMPLLGSNDDINNSLHKLFSDDICDEIDFQFSFVASSKVHGILSGFIRERENGNPISHEIAHRRSQMFQKSALESLSNHETLMTRHMRVFLTVSKSTNTKLSSKSSGDNTTNELVLLRDRIIHEYMANSIYAIQLSINESLQVLKELAIPSNSTCYEDSEYNPLQTVASQIADSDEKLRINDSSITCTTSSGEVEYSALAASKYSQHFHYTKAYNFAGELMGRINQIPCPFIITLIFRVEKSVGETGFVDKIKSPKKEEKAHSILSRIEGNITKKYYDEQYLQQYFGEGGKTIKAFFQVSLQSKPDEVTRNEAVVKRLYSALGITLKKYNELQIMNYLAQQPFSFSEGLYQDFRPMGWMKTMTVQNGVDLMPLYGEWYGGMTPAMLFTGRKGQLITFDNFDKGGKVGNYNIAISAQSGSGKSVLMQEMIAAKLGQGAKVYIIDNGRSYERLVELYGGEVIRFDRANPISLNFFSTLDETCPAFEDELQAIVNFIRVMAKPQGELNEVYAGILDRIVRDVWNCHKNASSIAHIHQALLDDGGQESKALSEMLYAYAYGAYRCYFEGQCSINFNSQITVIDLEDLINAGDLMQVILCAYINKIKSNVYQSDRSTQKLVVIDEAWKLLDSNSPMTARFIEEGYRCSRKYTCCFVTITQNIEDFYKNPTTKAAYDSSQFKIMMSQGLNKKKDKQYTLTDFEETLVESLHSNKNYSEFIIKEDKNVNIARLVLDPFSKALFTTTGADFKKIDTYRAQGLSLIESVDKLAQEIAVNE